MEDKNDNLAKNIINDMISGISHGVLVGNIAYELAVRLGLDATSCYNIKLAGLVHDVGKLKLARYLYGRNAYGLSIEEVKYMRMHSKIGYDYLADYDLPVEVMETVLRHHECFDGSGYPDNLVGEAIPMPARIIRVADAFAALISDRPYRKAFDIDTAVDVMIEENKNFDMKVFIEFQRFIHEPEALTLINNSRLKLDNTDIYDLLGGIYNG